MSTVQDAHAELVALEYNVLLEQVASLNPAKYLTPWAEGKAHPIWLLGHNAVVNDNLINVYCCDENPMFPAEWSLKFLPAHRDGIAPTPEAEFYPSWAELLNEYTRIMDRCVENIRQLSDAELAGGLRGNASEAIKERFKTVDNTLRYSTLHSAYHRGQMSLINLQD